MSYFIVLKYDEKSQADSDYEYVCRAVSKRNPLDEPIILECEKLTDLHCFDAESRGSISRDLITKITYTPKHIKDLDNEH